MTNKCLQQSFTMQPIQDCPAMSMHISFNAEACIQCRSHETGCFTKQSLQTNPGCTLVLLEGDGEKSLFLSFSLSNIHFSYFYVKALLDQNTQLKQSPSNSLQCSGETICNTRNNDLLLEKKYIKKMKNCVQVKC